MKSFLLIIILFALSFEQMNKLVHRFCTNCCINKYNDVYLDCYSYCNATDLYDDNDVKYNKCIYPRRKS